MNKSVIIKEILSYVLLIGIVLLIKFYIFTPIRVNGDSMNPTLTDGQFMFLNEIGYHINGVKRFDIVVVNSDTRLIKRVIGLPGDNIEYRGSNLYINGEIVEENFRHYVTDDFKLEDLGYDKIPEGYYLVLGDNRPNSKDSRMIGLVSKKQIMGKTNFIIYPFKEFGKVKNK